MSNTLLLYTVYIYIYIFKHLFTSEFVQVITGELPPEAPYMDPSILPLPRRAPAPRLMRTSSGRHRRHKCCSTVKEQPIESEYARDYQREWERERQELPTADEVEEVSEIDEVEEVTQSEEVPEIRASSHKIEQLHPQLGSSEETRALSYTIAVTQSEKAQFSNLNTLKLYSALKNGSRALNLKYPSLQTQSYASLDTLPQCLVNPSTVQNTRDITAGPSAEGPLARMLEGSISSLLKLSALSGSGTLGPEECNQSALKPQTLTLKAVCPVEQSQNPELSGSIADELDQCIGTITEVTGRITDQQQETGTLTRSMSQSDKDLSCSFACRLIELQSSGNSIVNSDTFADIEPPVPNLYTKTTQASQPEVMERPQGYSLLILPQTNQSTPLEMPQQIPSSAALSFDNSVQSSRIQSSKWDALQRGLLDWKWDNHTENDSDVESDVSSIAND